MFKLNGGLVLALYARRDIAKDANVAPSAGKTGDFTIGHAVADRKAVDDLLAKAKAAGRATSAIPMATCGRSSGTRSSTR